MFLFSLKKVMKNKEKLKLSDFFIIFSALITCFVVIAINIFIAKRWRFDVMTLTAGFMPYGAVIIGMLATSGSLLAAMITKRPLAIITLRSIPFFSLLTYFLYHYVNYIIDVVRASNDVILSVDIVSFFKYLHTSITQRVYISPTFSHNANPAHYGGYIGVCLEIIGIWAGGYVIIEYLKKTHKKILLSIPTK